MPTETQRAIDWEAGIDPAKRMAATAELTDSIASSFVRYFSVVLADTSERLEQVQRIRYSVYCAEFGYENPNDFPDGREFDDYDDHSVHALILHRPSSKPAGCVRMVPTLAQSPDSPLPFERYCGQSIDREFIASLGLDRAAACEISRLAVDGAFRRRGPKERQTRFGQVEEIDFSAEEQRTLPMIAVSAYLAATAITEKTGHTNVFAMMEPFLPRLMSRSGINFSRAGVDIEYHGTRAPYFITTQSALKTMNAQLRELYWAIRQQLFGRS
jgi:N-acyl amino acid synthase of PEP-CTERM/exosortase system